MCFNPEKIQSRFEGGGEGAVLPLVVPLGDLSVQRIVSDASTTIVKTVKHTHSSVNREITSQWRCSRWRMDRCRVEGGQERQLSVG